MRPRESTHNLLRPYLVKNGCNQIKLSHRYKIYLCNLNGEVVISHMIFSFLNDKAPLAPKYSGVSSLEVLHPSKFWIWLFNWMLRPSKFWIWLFNWMLRPFIFLIRFSDRISLKFSVYKLAFQILINTYELDFVASTSFTIQ